MNHYASPTFWSAYRALPAEIQALTDRCFTLLKADSRHPSIQFKKVGRFWSARVGLHYRALSVEVADGVLWFWVGTHAEYDRIVG